MFWDAFQVEPNCEARGRTQSGHDLGLVTSANLWYHLELEVKFVQGPPQLNSHEKHRSRECVDYLFYIFRSTLYNLLFAVFFV